MRCFVTGCAGFVGSQLVDKLLKDGHTVVGYDNFSTGLMCFLTQALTHQAFHLVKDDVLNAESLQRAMQGAEVVFHLAANADVRFGVDQPRKDLEQNTLATFQVLESMRVLGIKKIVFASTGSIYGEAKLIPTPENAPFPIQTSLYGASKLAAEGLIAAYCEGFGMQAYIFRFVSLLGERYTHGHVVDFYKALQKNPHELAILGNGQQKKSYLYVKDALNAMMLALHVANDKVNIFNLGTDEYCQVNDSVSWICQHLSLQPELVYSGGERGWIGDNPFIFLDCSKIRALGWRPTLDIHQAVVKTLEFLEHHFRLKAELS